jgi:signal peptide peptidase SppA
MEQRDETATGRTLLSRHTDRIWSILPSEAARIVAALREAADRTGTTAAAQPPATARRGSVAVLPVMGRIVQRGSFWSSLFGDTSTEALRVALREAVADPAVSAIVLDVDSPGGQVSGVPEIADDLYALRGRKPIVAVADTLMASAAYWIGSQADEVVIAPSGAAGSIGVFAMHVDQSELLAAVGITVSLISAGKYKVEGSPFEPLDDEARAAIQHDVDAYYGMFTRAVARGRGVSVADVRAGYGEGRVLTAQDAVREGLADRVDTLEGTIARLARGGRVGGARAEGPRDGADAVAEPDDGRRRRLELAVAAGGPRFRGIISARNQGKEGAE